MDVDAVLDRRTIDELLASTGGDPAFLAELIDAFLDDAPAQLEAIRGAAAAGETDAIVRPAHTLKSSAATFGAMALADRCRELEAGARAGTLADPVAAVEAVGAALAAALDALTAVRSTADAS